VPNQYCAATDVSVLLVSTSLRSYVSLTCSVLTDRCLQFRLSIDTSSTDSCTASISEELQIRGGLRMYRSTSASRVGNLALLDRRIYFLSIALWQLLSLRDSTSIALFCRSKLSTHKFGQVAHLNVLESGISWKSLTVRHHAARKNHKSLSNHDISNQPRSCTSPPPSPPSWPAPP
jgi:hypothetical protein